MKVYVRRKRPSIYRVSTTEHLDTQPHLQKCPAKVRKKSLRTMHEVLERPFVVVVQEKNQNTQRGTVYLKLASAYFTTTEPKLLVLVKHQLSGKVLLAGARKDKETLQLRVRNVVPAKVDFCSLLRPITHRLVDDRKATLVDRIEKREQPLKYDVELPLQRWGFLSYLT